MQTTYRWHKHNNFGMEVHYLHESVTDKSGNNWVMRLAKVYRKGLEPYRFSIKHGERHEEIREMCEQYLAELVLERMQHAS